MLRLAARDICARTFSPSRRGAWCGRWPSPSSASASARPPASCSPSPSPALPPCACRRMVLRSVHELFWALLLIQVFGLGPTTGVLAIAIPYTGIFAKVFAEMIEEADLAAERVLPDGTSAVSAFAFARLPEVAERFKTYTLYRLECGLRSTLVLGFVGLPTIGFHLECYFKQGHYAEAAALLGVFYVLIGTRRLWARPATRAVPAHRQPAAAARGDRRRLRARQPRALRHARHRARPVARRRPRQPRDLGRLRGLAAADRLATGRCPASWKTIVLSQIALVGMGILALLLFPFVSRQFAGPHRAARSAACCSSSCARRPSTCWPTCCCSCSVRPCCRRSSRSPCTTAPSSAI